MNNFIDEFLAAVAFMQKNLPFTVGIIGLLYVVFIVNRLLGNRLLVFGLYPRSLFGLPGIFTGPLLHGNFNHLFFNSIPLFILINFVLLAGYPTFYCVSLLILMLSGIAVWLVGRRSIHIGASGLIMGYWSYLLVNAYRQGTFIPIILGGLCLYYFGGLLLEIVPTKQQTSWEYHLFGFLAGVSAAYLCPGIS